MIEKPRMSGIVSNKRRPCKKSVSFRLDRQHEEISDLKRRSMGNSDCNEQVYSVCNGNANLCHRCSNCQYEKSSCLIPRGLLTVIGAWKSPSATGPLLQWKSPGSNNSVLIRAHIHGKIPYLVWKNPYTGYPWLSIYLNKSRLLTSLTVFSRMDHCRGMLEKVDVFAGMTENETEKPSADHFKGISTKGVHAHLVQFKDPVLAKFLTLRLQGKGTFSIEGMKFNEKPTATASCKWSTCKCPEPCVGRIDSRSLHVLERDDDEQRSQSDEKDVKGVMAVQKLRNMRLMEVNMPQFHRRICYHRSSGTENMPCTYWTSRWAFKS